jgi:hypothetical protein
MLEMFLVTTVLLAIPTSMLVLFCCFGMQGMWLPLGRLTTYGGLAGLSLSLFRLVPVPGLHSLLYILLIILLVRYVSGGKWSMAVLGALLTSVLTAVGEGLIGVPIISAMGVALVDTLTNPWWTLAGGWIGNSLLVVLALYLGLRKPNPAAAGTKGA